ncbi:MAG TPA: DMT family transporter [Terriglobales bacterium]|jgi:drug/metabolite transporter (DMT)-like permease|nr:DMT family transporter [Terriglobales bacterium]
MANLVSPGLSLSAAAAWGAADFSGGLAAKRGDTFGVVVVAHGTGLLFMLGLALLAHESFPDRTALLWGAAAGLVGGVGLAALYRALAIGTMSINAPLSAVIMAVLPLLFSFFTEGLPRMWQLAGFAVALVSIWLIAAQPGARGRNPGLGLAVLAGIGFSGFLLFGKLAAAHAVFWPLVSARAASTLLMLTIVLVRGRGWKPTASALPYMLVAGVLDSGANALYVAATQRGRLDVAAVLSSLYPASTVILARVFLKERLSRMQMAGIVAALVAVALIAAR